MKKSMFLSTIAMIVVVVVALSTATYAWFTTSTTPGVQGTMLISAAGDFTLRVESGANWVPADASAGIEIAGGGRMSPLSPWEAIVGDNYAKHSTDVDTVVTEGASQWFNAVGKSGAYSDCTIDNNAKRQTDFQLAVGDRTAQAGAKVYIQIHTAGRTATDLQAVKGAVVLLKVTSASHGTKYIGTEYSWGGDGLFDGEGASVTQATGFATATGAGTQVTDAGNLKAVPNVNSTSTEIATGYATIAAARADGNKEMFYLTTSDDTTTNGTTYAVGTYREMIFGIPFDAEETYTITSFIWLNGQLVDDAAAGKTLNISVKFTKS